MARPRAIFDCNTFVQAMAFEHGPAGQCLRLFEAGAFELLVSRSILSELRRVLDYAEVRAISPNLTDKRIGAFLSRIAFRSTLVRRVRHSIDFPRDPKDQPYLDLAVTTKPAFLVTRDKNMLWLMTGHAVVCKEFRRRAHPVRVVDPVQFLIAIGHSADRNR